MKIFLWILVIWVIISLIQGTIKEGSGWLAPFVAEYKYQFYLYNEEEINLKDIGPYRKLY